jgi:hypothetical protein
MLPEISGGLCDTSDRAALVERVVAFLAAGFRAPCPETDFQEVLAERKA